MNFFQRLFKIKQTSGAEETGGGGGGGKGQGGPCPPPNKIFHDAFFWL